MEVDTAEEVPGANKAPIASSSVADSLGINAREVVDDTIAAVLTYCADGFDAFDECVAGTLKLKDQQLQSLLQGSAAIYDRLTARVDQMHGFERLATDVCLHVPAGLILNQEAAMGPASQADEATEQALDVELHQMRQRITQARSQGRQHEADLQALDAELVSCGNVEPLAAVSASGAAGKENIAEDAAAIASAALKLQPLLARAQQLRSRMADMGLQARSNSTVAVVAEKEVLRRKAALGGALLEDLRRQQERLQL